MKSIKYFTMALCSVAAFAACKKSADVMVEPWIHDETLAVPVQIRSTSINMATKAGEINSLANVEFGVYALGQLDKPQAVLFQDQWAEGCNCIPSHVENGMAVLNTQEGPAYYPINSTNNYTFYGFHVEDDIDIHVNVEADSTVAIPQYGLVDVLWAEAKAEPIQDEEKGLIEGYCAKYIRYIYNKPMLENLPKLNFTHQTSEFIFTVSAADSHAEESFLAANGNVRVTSAVIKNLPETARLNVVTGEIIEESGSVERTWNVPAAGIRPVVAGAKIGEFFISPENAETVDGLVFEFTIKQRAIENETNVYTVSGSQIRSKFLADHGQDFTDFEQGYKYRLNISLQSAEKIEISVSLEPWTDGFDSDILEIE